MAATTSSPVLSNNGSETSANTVNSTPPPSTTPSTGAKSPNLPTITLQRPDPPKNLRGLNKPKCIKCGNEALTINEWRFAKLKEHNQGNIEAENEAFDRYMRNISLLEELFDVNSEMPDENSTMVSNPPTTSCEKMDIISETKVMLRSNPGRIDMFRKRIRQTIDEGLKKLRSCNSIDGPSSLDSEGDLAAKASKSSWSGNNAAWTELNMKLNRARNEEDLKLCIQSRPNITGQQKLISGKHTEKSEVLQTSQNDLPLAQESDVISKLLKTTEIDQDALNSVDFHFSSLEEIEDL
ncbi:Anaphase-promoting complex subunit cut9 [Bienertia sinuspersici]